jgi:hypothetical protein
MVPVDRGPQLRPGDIITSILYCGMPQRLVPSPSGPNGTLWRELADCWITSAPVYLVVSSTGGPQPLYNLQGTTLLPRVDLCMLWHWKGSTSVMIAARELSFTVTRPPGEHRGP